MSAIATDRTTMQPATSDLTAAWFEPHARRAHGGLLGGLLYVGKGALHAWPPILLFGVFIGVWQWWTASSTGIAYVPEPLEVYRVLVENPSFYWKHSVVTMKEALFGFAVGGSVAMVAAILMAEFRIAERALMPFAIMAKVTPAVAFAPALIVWLGFGVWPKVIIAALIVFFPLMVNGLTGFRSVDENALELFQSVNASRREIFLQLRMPNSLPYLFSAIKISVPLAVIGAVVAEYYNSFEGLGNVLVTSASNLQTARLYGAIVILVIIGLTVNFAVNMLERRMLRWHSSHAGLR